MPSIFCTKSILHPACPLFLANHDLPNIAFTIFPKILTNTLARALSFHFHVLDASFTSQTSTLVGLSTPLRSVFRLLSFWSTTVNFSELAHHSPSNLPPSSESWLNSVGCIHLCSLLLDCLCSSVKCLKPSIMLFLLLSQKAYNNTLNWTIAIFQLVCQELECTDQVSTHTPCGTACALNTTA